jgi:tellurite resistance protein
MSLGLGWANAVNVVPWVDEDLANLLLAAATGYFLWFVGFYSAKLIARPPVLWEDMRTPPARAGIAAMAMAMMLLAAALLPFGIYVPFVWWAGVIMQVFASAIVLYAIWKDPPEARHFTTFQYLTFVGPVVGPIAGVPLGYVWQSQWLIFSALAAYIIVTIGIIITLKKQRLPQPLRPSVMIFLAPICLFALGFGTLGYDGFFSFFYSAGDLVLLGLVFWFPWMIKGGYTPVWASFTFPLSAWFNVQVMALAKGFGPSAEIGTYIGMALATPIVLYLMYRTVMEWVTGDLAEKSHAAIA